MGDEIYSSESQLSKREFMLTFLYDIFSKKLFNDNDEFLLNYTSGFINAGFWIDGAYLSNERTASLEYLINYYYVLSGDYNLKRNLTNPTCAQPAIKYFLILKNNQDKMKYTLTNIEGKTFVTTSVGVILKYFESYKKSIKKSIKAHTLILRFVKNTITKMVGQDGYVFVVRGMSLRLFKLINFFNFCQKMSRMVLYILQPQQLLKKAIGKKVKSIKRKLQKKNLIKINRNYRMTRNIKRSDFII